MNQQVLAGIVILLCIICLLVYYKTTSFLRPWGIALFIIAISALCLRLSQINKAIAWFHSETIFQSVLIILIPALIFISFLLVNNKLTNSKRHYFMILLPLYVFFGALQQIFFLVVFTDSLSILFNDNIVVLVGGWIYFVLFHLNWGKLKLMKYFPFLVLFGFLNVYIYIVWENILPQLLIHGVVGSVLFATHKSIDQVKYRL